MLELGAHGFAVAEADDAPEGGVPGIGLLKVAAVDGGGEGLAIGGTGAEVVTGGGKDDTPVGADAIDT